MRASLWVYGKLYQGNWGLSYQGNWGLSTIYRTGWLWAYKRWDGKPENYYTGGGGRKFRLDELFEIKPSKYYDITNDLLLENNWKTPVISNTNVLNWTMWYSNYDSLNEWNILTCSDTTIWADTMFYQKQSFIGYSHIQTLTPRDKFNKLIAMFIISLVRKATWNAYSYWTKFNRKAMWNTEIILPVNSDNQINYSLIETYIKATQKLVIKDLVENINEKLKTYKEII